ncbi:MAG TPA: serine/threonine-protein kinase [Kofleriaceae bacterium]|jgi:serine/threonine-protein kinase|nr:serine/threonine-protein kinase [Kofleriaceae bacterium]
MESLSATAAAHQFGKYSLVARLATGGMAEIFLARLQGAAGFEKLVCIKRILPHLARDRQFVAMFLDEARIAARITHPNVCQVFELGEIQGSYYLAMEYLEGVPLACFRRNDYYGPEPDPRLVAGIAIQACEGMHHAHQLRNTDGSVMEVVHRDMSPQNLFVTADGIVKVLDFGIAKIHDATIRTTTGAIKGTYAYMAPEQLRGERVDRRTDVFALGIVMWETLARRHLFKRDTEFLTFQAITSEPIEDICAIRPDVSPALSSVIMTALARDRGERFPTARMLGEAIAAAVQPLTGSAISEEIQRAFPNELAEQAELIRVAREGGSFDLDVERGPSVGHGADLMTTPVSRQQPAAKTISDGGRPPVHDSAARTPPVIRGTPAPGGSNAGAPAPRLPSAVPRLRPSMRPLVIAVLALAAGGAGALIYARLTREPPRADEVAGVERGSGAHPSAAVVEPPPAALAAPAAPATPPGAKPAAPPADPGAAVPGSPPAGSPSSAPPAPTQDAAAGAGPSPAPPAPPISAQQNAAPITGTARPTERRSASSSRPPASKPGGPPGFITIDASPGYAVIYIDGKSYGETPLAHLELSPGRHLVHAVSPSGAMRDVRIAIESGKVAPTARIVW